MRTRLVRVRRRPKGVVWAMVFLALAMALYIRASMPAMMERQASEAASAEHGERTTRQITLDSLAVWLISFGQYDDGGAAQVEAARYVPRGAAGYVLEGERFSVIGAGYTSQKDAEKVCAQLAETEGIRCSYLEAGAPAVTLRMTAGSEQIEAFLEGEQRLRDTAGAMGQLAFSVDRGDATSRQAAEVIGTHLKSVRRAAARLDEQAGQAGGETFDALRSMLEDMAGQMEDMMKESGAMILSSRLKGCHVEFRTREIEWLNGLGAAG